MTLNRIQLRCKKEACNKIFNGITNKHGIFSMFVGNLSFEGWEGLIERKGIEKRKCRRMRGWEGGEGLDERKGFFLINFFIFYFFL